MKPWLYLPPFVSYRLSPFFIQIHGGLFRSKSFEWSSLTWRGLEFKNPLGLAGGVDKDGKNMKNWWSFGPGFIEIGTVTPKPQSRNSGKVLDHDRKRKSLWNYLGFPNQGLKALVLKLKKQRKPYFTPVFVSIGKNRWTDNERAVEDFIYCVKELKELADAFVINISSPNTKNLRALFNQENLSVFLNSFFFSYKKLFLNDSKKKGGDSLSGLRKSNPLPVFIKLSPDHNEQEFEDILKVTYEQGVDGWVVTNSSLGSSSRFDSTGLRFPKFGGISGELIKEVSRSRLKQTVCFLKNKQKGENKNDGKGNNGKGVEKKGRLIVASGGILEARDVFERLAMGAHLVQVYSGLVFNGPFFFKDVFKAYQSKKKQEGF